MVIKKAKIILYNPLPREKKDIQDNYIITPMSLLAVSALLDKEGFEVIIIDETIDDNHEELLFNNAKDALFLGITMITGHQIENGIRAVKFLRNRGMRLPIVVGGYHPSILPLETINSPYVDFVVYGQGQRTTIELAKAILEKIDFKDVAGLIYKENGKIIINPPRPFEDINNFPSTPYHLVDLSRYIYDCTQSGFGSRNLAIYTSQGCPWKCGFCAENKVTHNRWSGLSAKRVVDEIGFLVNKMGVNSILIYDTNFVVDKNRLKSIFGELKNRGIVIPFGFINARADWLASFDEELWQLIKPYIKDVLIGAESGIDKILEFINKGIKVEDLYEAKRVLRKHNITAGYSFMIGLPVPEEFGITIDQEFKAIMLTIAKIKKIDNNNNIRIFNYTPYPGTPLFNQSIKKGLKIPNTLEEWSKWDNETAKVAWIPKKYELILDQLNRYILPYMSRQFDDHWEIRYQGKFKPVKKIFHNFLKFSAKLRFELNWFSFPVEYWMLLFVKKQKAMRKHENTNTQ